MAQLGLTTASVCGRFAVENEKARERLEDLGAFATDALADSPLQRASELPQSFAKMLSRSMSAISSIASERGSDATPGQPLPAALPHQLARMRGREFGKLLREQRKRLLCSFSEDDLVRIEEEQLELREAYRKESVVKRFLDNCGPNTSFKIA